MSFADPINLLALLALPLVAAVWAASRARRRRFAVRHPGVAALRAALPRRPRWRAIVPAALLGASAVALTGKVPLRICS